MVIQLNFVTLATLNLLSLRKAQINLAFRTFIRNFVVSSINHLQL